jgi:hypothetical protein
MEVGNIRIFYDYDSLDTGTNNDVPIVIVQSKFQPQYHNPLADINE